MSDPHWLDRTEYPFAPHYFELPMGRLHYVDEGDAGGEPVVMVHGNPSWSFMYRKQIADLSARYRVIAPDHIGFGLSDKPRDWSYLPRDHAANFERLMEELGLRAITLVVHDWGGPIGLSYAVAHPERVRRLVILNTWMWSLAGEAEARRFSGVLGSWPGSFAIRRLNFFVRVLMPTTFPDRALFRACKEHYLGPFSSAAERRGIAVFPREVVGSSEWLDELWAQRARIAAKPALVVWAMKDPAFRKKAIERWRGLLEDHRLERQHGIGHYVAEEMGHRLSPLIADFIASTGTRA